MSTHEDETGGKAAACACGAVRVTTMGAPVIVNACACLDCQRRSGSAFTYTAFFADAQVGITGELRSFRQTRSAGRWHEASFCVVCGVSVLSRLEVFPGLVGVSVGCFTDPAFAPPGGFYWASRRHTWLPVPTGVEVFQTQ
jgi:hypothetical protein